MPVTDELLKVSNGAQFRRGDLHIHSYGGSYDVEDRDMTPEAIVDTALRENLQLIAITDHNSIANVDRAVNYAAGKKILVVPGVELSTPQGHLLIYCPTPEKLKKTFYKLRISGDSKSCTTSMTDCLRAAEEFDGFGIAAHVETEGGLEKGHPKFDDAKHELFCMKNLLGLEIKHLDRRAMFSLSDENPDRRNCAVERCKRHGLEEEVDLAKVMNSDAHTLVALGKNASGSKKLTRFKMETLSFDSLKVALKDCAARVRLEDLIPQSIPHFIGMKIEGGFLKDQIIHFSKNLTCIIGGRGAGKSTMLESLRICSGNPNNSDLVDSEVWPDRITLYYQDEVGEVHELSRSKSNDVMNADDPIDGMTHIGIESYGQGETAGTITRCDEDPAILLRFLDDFIDLGKIMERDEQICKELLDNQTDIERMQRPINRIPEVDAAKKAAEKQVETLKSQNAGALVEMEQKLANQRRFRQTAEDKLDKVLTTLTNANITEPLTSLVSDFGAATLAVDETDKNKAKAVLNELVGKLNTHVSAAKGDLSTARATVMAFLRDWAAKESETQNRIESIRQDLEKQNIKLDMLYIRKVTKDAADRANELNELTKVKPLQAEAFKQRKVLLDERRAIRSRLFTIRSAYAKRMTENMAATVVEYTVKLRYYEGMLSDDLEAKIKTRMDWRTSAVPKAAVIVRSLGYFALLDAITTKNPAPIQGIRDEHGNQVFSHGEAKQIIDKLSVWEARTEIERCPFQDRPEITINKIMPVPGKPPAHTKKDFTQLSLGQQQSILLSIMLFSKSTKPLIIDQPEDNLDSEFIYKTLVRTLRSVKEQRQVIIVTHNANIAVLGDAELIIPLRGQNDSAVIRDRGSIDTPQTKDIVCTILEGSKTAFRRRLEMYGID